ncbi:MAG: response regulator [Zhongshania sp.]|jgi:two-component system OmpR family response regulator|nr:response regulator [Zhongshania sp.]
MNNTITLTRLMYIEDEPDIRAVAEIALRQVAGFEVKICENGYEGIEAIHSFNPQLVLLDVMMPNLDGPQILKKIHAMPEFQNTPMIFITAKAQTEEIDKLKKLGALDVITKPFNPMTIGNDIRIIWQRYHESKR